VWSPEECASLRRSYPNTKFSQQSAAGTHGFGARRVKFFPTPLRIDRGYAGVYARAGGIANRGTEWASISYPDRHEGSWNGGHERTNQAEPLLACNMAG